MAGNLRAYLAELLGTYAVVLFAAGAVCADSISAGKVGLVGIALAYGMAVLFAGSCYGRVSGGHFNPALTLARLVVRRIEVIKAVFYVIAQLVGATLAAMTLQAVLKQHPDLLVASPYLGAMELHGIGYKAGTLLEALGAFFLAMTAFSGDKEEGFGSPIAVGMAVTACVLAIGLLTGSGINPARAFGPSIITGFWTHWYVYWIGPLCGAIAAAWIHEHVYSEKKGARP